MFADLPRPLITIFPILIVVWLAAYIIGMKVGRKDPTPYRQFARGGKVAMIVLVILVAVLGWIFTAVDTPFTRFALWITLGLIFGGLGDIILADLSPFEKPLIPGIIAFAIGHISYTIAIFTLRDIFSVSMFSYSLIGLAIAFVFNLTLWLIIVRRSGRSTPTKIGILVYGFLVAGVAALAVVFTWQTGILFTLALGLVLFFISDLLLVGDITESYQFPNVGDAIWIIYSTGQLLIALSVATWILEV